MKTTFILVTLILALVGTAQAEIWKCQREEKKIATYTDTPTGEPGVNCETVEAIRFTRSGVRAGGNAAADSRNSATSGHVTKKARAKVKSETEKSKSTRTKRVVSKTPVRRSKLRTELSELKYLPTRSLTA